MSSNPLMMGYEGGDLLLTVAAWPTVGSLPKPLCAGCGRWPGRPAAPVSDESALEVAGPQDALYKLTSFLYLYLTLINLTLVRVIVCLSVCGIICLPRLWNSEPEVRRQLWTYWCTKPEVNWQKTKIQSTTDPAAAPSSVNVNQDI